ncbi:hypothetical protein [Naasia lichenicola]|uniref:SRPBCC family protein n=1 Tax=Naasia lichenicola TaxID=2565933 RepID=A0A4S4FH65_9MICO|nr:hypothetical protein [Naasia lichenicola]THG29639.1 hypothetical protein E6C64_13275 [Naasia lichenicola]
MQVFLKLILDCEPQAAWRAIQSPAVLREVMSPALGFQSLEEKGFPTRWPPGEHPVTMKALFLPIGEQIINIEYPERRHVGVQIMRDNGRGVSGATSVFRVWDHRIAIAADPAGTGKTLYRDRLKFDAGVLSAAAWPVLWSVWQYRGLRLQQEAPTWWSMIGELKAPAAGQS